MIGSYSRGRDPATVAGDVMNAPIRYEDPAKQIAAEGRPLRAIGEALRAMRERLEAAEAWRVGESTFARVSFWAPLAEIEEALAAVRAVVGKGDAADAERT